MSRHVMLKRIGILLAITATAPAVAFGPGEAAGARRPGPSAKPFPEGTDFVVLVWYRRDDPLETFRHQIYDLRKREYTPAVDDWIRDTRTRYPSYLVLVRTVDLSRERGETEKLKVGSVIYRELMVAAARSGVVLGAPITIGPGPYAGQGKTPNFHQMPVPDRSYLNPDPNRYPITVYPRTRTP